MDRTRTLKLLCLSLDRFCPLISRNVVNFQIIRVLWVEEGGVLILAFVIRSVLCCGIRLDFPRTHSLMAMLTFTNALNFRIHLDLFHQAGFAL